MTRWQWALRLLTHRMWFRAALFCLFAVVLALVGVLIGDSISYEFATKIGAKSVGNILNVLASSMLAVTTFSLTAMVSAYSGATSNITPRAVQLLIDDTTAQNALATFLGSFLFAIVGIIALSTGLYGDSGRVILYLGTIIIIIVIVLTFLHWIEHVTHFGRVADTISRVEKAATDAVPAMVHPLVFGAVERHDPPAAATKIRIDRIGRITNVDLNQLGDVAKDIGQDVHAVARPGTMVDPARVVAWTMADVDEEQQCRIRDAFTVAGNRAFDHDPRFGLIVLSEIASRALSPAVNDPGTPIAVLEAGSRVMAEMLRYRPDAQHGPPAGVVVQAMAFRDLLEDFFRPISRYGASMAEPAIRLQHMLATLSAIAPEATADCFAEAVDALERARTALPGKTDIERLEEVHRRCWFGGSPEASAPRL